MRPIAMVVVDLAGTTVNDGGIVLQCLVDVASEYELRG